MNYSTGNKRAVRLAKMFLPPIVTGWLKKLISAAKGSPFEYVPEGWSRAQADNRVKGWNVESVSQVYQSKWQEMRGHVSGVAPLGLCFEAEEVSSVNLSSHNMAMTLGYVLALASRNEMSLSILDWGGGIGHYRVLAGALLPGIEIDYHCKEVPMVCKAARQLMPDAHFYESDSEYAGKQFDLVMASGSLQYALNWEEALTALTQATKKYLYITRLPVVISAPSYVMVQRPYEFGYDTEYLSWCLNRNAFVDAVEKRGLRLIREFITGETIEIVRAPEQCIFRGFLFRANSAN